MKRIIFSLAMLSLVFSVVANNPDKKGKEKVKPIDLDQKSFIERVFDFENSEEWNYIGDKPAIIDFWAAWCGPCRQVSPILEELADEYGDEIYVYKVNVDEQKSIARAFGIQSLPTILFVPLKDTPQAVLGSAPKSKLKGAVDSILLKKEQEK